MSEKFPIGTRVRHIDNALSVPFGTLGTVVPPDSESLWTGPHVLWDEMATDSSFPVGYVWAAADYELEAVK